MTEHILTALAALAAVTEARRWLADAPAVEAQPGLRRASTPRDLSTRAAVRSDRLLSLERAERRVTDIPTIAHQVPIRAGLLDTQRAVDEAVVDAAWIVASGLRRGHGPTIWAVDRAGGAAPAWWPTARMYREPWSAAVIHLRVHIPALVCDCPVRSPSGPDLPMQCPGGAELRTPHPARTHRGGCLDQVAQQVGQVLTRADDRARNVLGVGPAWVPLGLACDTCHRRTVEAEVSSKDERQWIVRCGNRCWIRPIQEHPRARSIAVLKSMRRHHERELRRGRIAA